MSIILVVCVEDLVNREVPVFIRYEDLVAVCLKTKFGS